MRKHISVGILVAGTLGAGVLAGVAIPASAGASNSGRTTQYVGTFENTHADDAKPAGDSIGDRTVDLFKLSTASGKPAGTISNACVLLRPGADVVAQCYGQLTLPDGTLATELSPSGGPKSTAAILGGTGAYVGADGVVITDFLKSGRLSVTVQLR